MRLLHVKKTNGRPAYNNLDRVIYILYDETKNSYLFYFGDPEQSVQAHPEETEKIERVIAQYQA